MLSFIPLLQISVVFYAKNGPGSKKQLICDNDKIFRSGKTDHFQRLCTISQNDQFRSELKSVKNVQENVARITQELFCAKKGSKKHLIFENNKILKGKNNYFVLLYKKFTSLI